MIIKVSVPSRFQFKIKPSFRNLIFAEKGEIHYIGGSDVLPAPLDMEQEAEEIAKLGTQDEKEAKSVLIEHNLRLVVYIAKKFDNTRRTAPGADAFDGHSAGSEASASG